jgi:signal-transduction protein with cAMP-binding, CBS, and nucleotidyltransferase domain
VTVIRDDDYLYHAIGVMRRRRLRHMPVVDASGAAVGIFELHDALSVASAQMVDRIDKLTHEGTIAGLAQVKHAQAAVADQLLADNLPAPDVLGLISQVNGDLYRRAMALSLTAMAGAGEAEPPVPFALIVMGSGGRGESAITADQDNGLIIADYPDADHDAIDGFFRRLAARMTETLDAIGLPFCRGGVMATNPLWRKTLGQWRTQIDGWMRRPAEAPLRLADIFFDFRAVHGDPTLARALRDHVTERAARASAFLNAMQAAQSDHRTALGLFGRLQTEPGRAHRGQINLKYRAGLPLVEALRLLALRHGVAETGTMARIAALAEAGVLERDEHERLRDAFMVITELLLRHQIRSLAAGGVVDSWIRRGQLRSRARRRLVESLKAIESLRAWVRSEFTADAF